MLLAAWTEAVWLDADGALRRVSAADAAGAVVGGETKPPIVCHAPATARRLNLAGFPAFDALELFAFVRPAGFCAPTPNGLRAAIDSGAPPASPQLEDQAIALRLAVEHLLRDLAEQRDDARAAGLAGVMDAAGWSWGPAARAALGAVDVARPRDALAGWRDLPEWSDAAPPPPPGSPPLAEGEAPAHRDARLPPPADRRTPPAALAEAAA
ncbi:MAG: ATP-dependent DNA helicase, partial [Pseudomonadota bacterium]